MTANTQRVDVERLPATWRENYGYEMHGLEWDLGYRQALQTCATELEAALPALLQQLAEREAEITRLNRLADAISRDCNDCANQRNEAMAKAVAAERAREEACGLLRDVIAWRRTVSIDETPNRKDGGISGRIAAFLAASGGDRP